MVARAETKTPVHGQPLDPDAWLAAVSDGRSDAELKYIGDALEQARQAHQAQTRASGEPYLMHCLAVAEIVHHLNLDHKAIAGAILHDVGKIGIPDSILQKPDRLSREERQVMNSHTVLGRHIVDDLIANFGFELVPYIDYLRHIAELHHESMDGSGYPHGLRGEEISLDARIVAVSDVFDALTTCRPYKEPWSNAHAFAMLKLLSIDKLDKGCVSALIDSPNEVAMIQQQFAEVA